VYSPRSSANACATSFSAPRRSTFTLARFTEDLDLFIGPDRDKIERLKAALRAVFDDPTIEEISRSSECRSTN
jgi:hypothetical protein